MVFYHNSTNFDATLLFPYTWDKIRMDVHTCFVYFTILAPLDVVCDNLCAFNRLFLVMVVCVPITNGWNQWHKWIATWIKLTKWWDFTICRWYYIHGKWYHQFIWLSLIHMANNICVWISQTYILPCMVYLC